MILVSKGKMNRHDSKCSNAESTTKLTMHTRPVTFLLAGSLFLGLALRSGAQSGTKTFNGFNISNAIIPSDEIRSGGPPRDGIPSIDRPSFLRPRQVDYLSDNDLVVSVTLDGVTRAYPLRILVRHEIVNDQIGKQAFVVTYCPLCGTAMVFDRLVGGRRRSFGVSGLLYQSDVLLYDRESESLFSQLAMKAVAGPLAGARLAWLPTEHMTWAAWVKRYPHGEVLSNRSARTRDYTQNPYEGYDRSPNTVFPVPRYRSELPKKSWVLGVVVEGQAKAYPIAQLAGRHPVSDVINGVEIVVSYDAELREPKVVDAASGRLLPFVQAYWFGWQAFYPETAIWKPQD